MFRCRKGMIEYGSLCLAFALVLLVVFQCKSDKSNYKGGTAKEWIKAYTSKNFETCDSMVLGERDKIFSYDIDLTGTYAKSVDMYKALLDASVNCIDEVLILDKKDDLVNIQVSLKSVKSATDVVVDEKALNDLVNKYTNNEIKEDGFKQKLEELYYNSFKDTVLTGFDSNVKVKVINVRLKEADNSVSKTYDFIRQILKDSGLLENMKFFEESAQSTFNVYLRKDK